MTSKLIWKLLYDDSLNRESYMSAHVLLNLVNELRNLSLFRNEFNKFNNTGARVLSRNIIMGAITLR